MTTIKASCPTCGPVDLAQIEVTLIVCSQTILSYYAFNCPKCIEVVVKPADDHIIALLISAGVTAEVRDIPAEALELKVGPPLTYDDILDFNLQLRETNLLVPYLKQSAA